MLEDFKLKKRYKNIKISLDTYNRLKEYSWNTNRTMSGSIDTVLDFVSRVDMKSKESVKAYFNEILCRELVKQGVDYDDYINTMREGQHLDGGDTSNFYKYLDEIKGDLVKRSGHTVSTQKKE